MSPVGGSNLANFLERVSSPETTSEFRTQARVYIRRWYACIASVLSCMHGSGVRYQDIKPSNIVHRGDRVFFTDFGSSSTFDIDHTTSTDAHARLTAMYGAPEMVLHCGEHGRSSDIFCPRLCVLRHVDSHERQSSFKISRLSPRR
ncbi:hypothetical protein BU25DRAFT_481884 [Macroventuria anomochaeta]|uniref:Uncharacterized protein n=1 Tax=Macroventuria anomochaeta TaxID=301207 RepID=A0ACB6SAH0_9PLEO|nr:uncharacterized protein BU25DRAFT_481884 [Macroventuria anomochaeta]KAF2631296.1 hypothetical protein BU25DRAFT_481884 [Macroventuria anomochaeta]